MSVISFCRRLMGIREVRLSFYDSQKVMKDAVERIFLNNIVDFTLFSDDELRALVTGESNIALVHAAERELRMRRMNPDRAMAAAREAEAKLGDLGLHGDLTRA